MQWTCNLVGIVPESMTKQVVSITSCKLNVTLGRGGGTEWQTSKLEGNGKTPKMRKTRKNAVVIGLSETANCDIKSLANALQSFPEGAGMTVRDR